LGLAGLGFVYEFVRIGSATSSQWTNDGQYQPNHPHGGKIMPTPNIDTFLNDVHTAFSNLRDDSEPNSPMEPAGYTTTRIDELIALHDSAVAAHQTQLSEYADQYGVTAAFNQTRETAHTAYIRHLTLARVAFKNDVTRTHQLGLQGQRKLSFAG
jgi:hypothetical protein